jgi:hypothetical protein
VNAEHFLAGERLCGGGGVMVIGVVSICCEVLERGVGMMCGDAGSA